MLLWKTSAGVSRVECSRVMVLDSRCIDQKAWDEQMKDEGVENWQTAVWRMAS